MQGRKPTPNTVKSLRGNPGKRPLKRTETVAKKMSKPLKMPKDLPDSAQKEWRRVVPTLFKLGIVNHLDQMALADYCLCVHRLEQCEQEVTDKGVLIQSRDRGMVKNPALQLAREYRTSIQKWADQFGLTPSSRGRMNLPVEEEHDEFEEFLNGGGDDDEEGDDSYEDA